MTLILCVVLVFTRRPSSCFSPRKLIVGFFTGRSSFLFPAELSLWNCASGKGRGTYRGEVPRLIQDPCKRQRIWRESRLLANRTLVPQPQRMAERVRKGKAGLNS